MENETLVRLAVFIGLFAVLACAEALRPRRARAQARQSRWTTNWGIVLLNTLTLRLMAFALPALAAGAALDAAAQGWGLFNKLDWPFWIEALLVLILFDFAIWLQHLITHKIPLLWRIHRVHHTDRDMDVTTAIRFHPFEIALSMLLKVGLVYLIGPSVFAIVLFEIILNGTAMFNHANLKLPLGVDRVLRLVIVTPDMHRVHHSPHRYEHDGNYGFALSTWDRLFGTYVAQPAKPHDQMVLGLHWQDERPAKLGWALALPFFRK